MLFEQGTKLTYVHAPGKDLPGGRLLDIRDGWQAKLHMREARKEYYDQR